MKIAVCTSDFYAPVHESIKESGHEVSQVFTSLPLDSDWCLKTAQFAHDMRAELISGEVTPGHIKEMIDSGVDLLISAAYDYKVPVPEDGSLKCINVHGTLLPEGRGPWPAPQILLKYPEAAGLTLHTMTNKWDFGEIVLQEKIEVSPKDDSDSLIAKTIYLARKLSRELLGNFDRLWDARKQMQGPGTYWRKPTDAERTVSPFDEAERITAIFRAFGRDTLFSPDGTSRGKEIEKLVVWKQESGEQPGLLVASNNSQRIYAIRGGLLSVYCDASFVWGDTG